MKPQSGSHASPQVMDNESTLRLKPFHRVEARCKIIHAPKVDEPLSLSLASVYSARHFFKNSVKSGADGCGLVLSLYVLPDF